MIDVTLIDSASSVDLLDGEEETPETPEPEAKPAETVEAPVGMLDGEEDTPTTEAPAEEETKPAEAAAE